MRIDTATEISNGEEPFFLCYICNVKCLKRDELRQHLIKDHTEKEAQNARIKSNG